MLFTPGTRSGSMVTQRKQNLFVLHGGAEARSCHPWGGCGHTHIQTKRTWAVYLGTVLLLGDLCLVWGPWGSVLSLVSLQGMGRPGELWFCGKLPSEVVSFSAAYPGLDLHEGTLAISLRPADFLCPMHSWPWDSLTTKLHLVGDPQILSCG